MKSTVFRNCNSSLRHGAREKLDLPMRCRFDAFSIPPFRVSTRRVLPVLLLLLVLRLNLVACAEPDGADGPAAADARSGGEPAERLDASAGPVSAPDLGPPDAAVLDPGAPDTTTPAVTPADATQRDAAPPDAGLVSDPLAVALGVGAGVSSAELVTTITDLQALGTRYTYSDGDEAARDYLSARLRAYGYEPELDAFTFRGETAENLIARKAGTEQPEVVFIFSAHYDSTSEEPDSSAPGADDNASAVAVVLEAARLLADVPLRHSVWFVLTAAEEQGSVGSAHLARRLATEHVDVQGVIAPDMIGYWPLGDDDAFDILGDTDSAALVDHMAQVADALGVAYKRWIEHEYCYGDDHTMFQEAGFPAISPMDCVEAHNLPATRETLGHYHRSTDTLETLHIPFTTRVAAVIVATLTDLAVPQRP